MSKLNFPDNAKSALDCADWMELVTLVSPERRCSISAVERNLKRLSTYDAPNTIQQTAAIENACGEVLGEIKRRAKAAQDAYPFKLHETSIVFDGDIRKFVPYIFCLCLSWFGWQAKHTKKNKKKARKGARVFPDRMFEDLSKHAAQAFVGGRALRFGAPRRDLPTNFKKALFHMAREIGEGQAKDIPDNVKAKDDTLDLIAWRDFPDGREGKLFLVGQCASGWDWESKKRELDIVGFFNDWFADQPPSLRGMRVGLFIPHRVPGVKWVPITRRAGIIFDRCRIAYLSHKDAGFTEQEPHSEWLQKTLAKVQQK